MEKATNRKLPICSKGLAEEAIALGETGSAYFPEFKERFKVRALKAIRQYRDIIIVEANNGAIEHTLTTSA